MKYKRYDVYLAQLPKASGSIQQGTRPVVIYNITNYDYLNNVDRLILECYALTSEAKNKLPVHFVMTIARSCMREESTFLAEQVFTLYEGDLIHKIGVITDTEYRYQINRTICIQQGIPTTTFNYSYEFLVQAKKASEFITATWGMLKEKKIQEPSAREELNLNFNIVMDELRGICTKHKVRTSKYITDLSNKNIDLSLLNL